MKATKIFVQNDTTVVIHVQAYVENGEFLIVINRRLPLGRIESVPPGNAASYPVNAAVQACMGPKGLRYVIRNKMGEKVSVSLGRDPTQQALVFHITTEGN